MASNFGHTAAPHQGVSQFHSVVDSVGSIGSKFRNKYSFLPSGAPTHHPCTPRGLPHAWGVDPREAPWVSVRMPTAHLGASTSLALLSPCGEAHPTPLRESSPSTQGSTTQQSGTTHCTVPLRGSAMGLRSPSPDPPVLVRAYGSLRVYDPRHFCVPCTTRALMRLDVPSPPRWTVPLGRRVHFRCPAKPLLQPAHLYGCQPPTPHLLHSALPAQCREPVPSEWSPLMPSTALVGPAPLLRPQGQPNHESKARNV